MSDRALLEAAARAVGINGVYRDDDEFLTCSIEYTDDDDCQSHFAPLDNDAHAFWTMVQLGITVNFANEWVAAYAGTVVAEQFSERFGADPCAATRRAVVRAAAAMAKER